MLPSHELENRSNRTRRRAAAGGVVDRWIVICYAATLTASAILLFSVQPLVARLVLPRLGGSPAVWNTCLVFFQALLLAGYSYALLATRLLGVRQQTVLHAMVVLLPCLALPLALPGWESPAEADPTGWLLALLAVSVGGPFFALATSAPLLQRWFAATRHPRGGDPYFLYAWSNAGSLTALCAYPLVIEPLWGLRQTSLFWSLGYVGFVVLTIRAALIVWRWPQVETAPATTDAAAKAPRLQADDASARPAVDWRQRLMWLALAAVPTSWMLAVTTHLTTDLAPAPLLWIAPLALYLATYIVAFGPWAERAQPVALRLFPAALMLLAASLLVIGRWQLLAIDLAAFGVGALLCHCELARRRPAVRNLAEYYFWISLGGVLGGAFNALLAPLIFPAVYEYPLAVAMACLLVPATGAAAGAGRSNLWLIAGTTLVIALMRFSFPVTAPTAMVVSILTALAALVVLWWLGRVRWFALAMALLLAFQQSSLGIIGQQQFVGRSFFGVHRVVLDIPPRPSPENPQPLRFLRLHHGRIIHGMQAIGDGQPCEPRGYYAREGPLGEIFAAYPPRQATVEQAAVVGLGTGAAACYAGPRRFITFYEIDPLVARLAESHFSYLSRCGGEHVRVELGDGRLRLAAAPDGAYRLIVLDAFSADAIPIHLLTREALAMMLEKLAPQGLIAYHITNNHLDLAPVLARLAEDAGLAGLVRRDLCTEAEIAAGRLPATYVALARTRADLQPLLALRSWQPIASRDGDRLWTDDYANILAALKWDPEAMFAPR